MPIYEFECLECETQFEEVVLGDTKQIKCPHCDSTQVKKLMSTGSFVTGGPIVMGTPGSRAITTRGTSPCASCGRGNCSSCGVK